VPDEEEAMPRRTAFLFPGQGRIPDALPPNVEQFRDLLDIAGHAGLRLQEWIEDGRTDRLTRTDAAQPALLLDSLCREKLLTSAGWQADYVAGHSLGEYSALVCSGVLSAHDAMRAVIERGCLMEGAQGTMAAILKLDVDTVAELCADTKAVVANHNAPAQIVVSGPNLDVQEVVSRAESRGGRGIPLRVSGPFHSPLMQDAQDALAAVLAVLDFARPKVPIVSSVTGRVEREAEPLKDLMLRQMTAMVRWVDVTETLSSAEVDTAIEVGSGDVLTRLGNRSGLPIRFITFEEAMNERL
jgi:[acyl-carrier-protein] S-malonyltransferase